MLAASNLTYERYFMPVFQPVSFVLSAHDILVVTGPNGSGKTTLIRMLAGVLPIEFGELKREVGRTAYIGHQLAVKDDLSTEENIRFMRTFLGHDEAPGTEAILARMGLEHVALQPARSLSAGQRKRCGLARLLVSGAGLWLMDEPYSNLDDDGVELVDELVRDHARAGGACVMATHGRHRPGGHEIRELTLSAANDSGREGES